MNNDQQLNLQEIIVKYGSTPEYLLSFLKKESIIRILTSEDWLKFNFENSSIDINPGDADINGYLDILDFHKIANLDREWTHLCSQDSNSQEEISSTIEVFIHVSEGRKILQDYLQKRDCLKK